MQPLPEGVECLFVCAKQKKKVINNMPLIAYITIKCLMVSNF